MCIVVDMHLSHPPTSRVWPTPTTPTFEITYTNKKRLRRNDLLLTEFTCNWCRLLQSTVTGADFIILLGLTPDNFFLANSRRFYSSWGEPSFSKKLNIRKPLFGKSDYNVENNEFCKDHIRPLKKTNLLLLLEVP